MREEVDLPTVEALQRAWRRNPPVHRMVAAYLGYEPPFEAPAAGSVREDPDVSDLLAELGRVPVRKYTPIDTTAFDAAMADKAAREAERSAGYG